MFAEKDAGRRWIFTLCFSSHLATMVCGASIVYPDTHWNDTNGERIEAHAAGMLRAPDNRWYWYGESKKDSNLATHGVNCYSAPTIAGPWTNEGQVLTQAQIVAPGAKGPFVVERPKVLYNAATKKFVMWFHLDDSGYKYRHVGTATADQPQGPFTWVAAFQPDGIPSLDMNLFRDPLDGTAYFIRSCDNRYAGISRLSHDYLTSTGIISNHSKVRAAAVRIGPHHVLGHAGTTQRTARSRWLLWYFYRPSHLYLFTPPRHSLLHAV